jgi:hypothetical protein
MTQKCYSPPTNGLVSSLHEVKQMKLNRLILASIIGISLATPAWACEPSSGGIFSFFHHTDSDHNDSDHDRDHHRECDQNGQNSGRGNNCDNGKGNGGGYCGTGSGTSGGGGSTSTGSGAPAK